MSAPVETLAAAPTTEVKPTELAAPAAEPVAAPETSAAVEVPKEEHKVEAPAATIVSHTRASQLTLDLMSAL